ncbi:MAG: peptide deformylase, partial [Deltaproteobacteria bacterium]|nr:peptide deformylase [Deltaproteobacteria bacterium]
MSILKIARMGHPVLRMVASEVRDDEFKDPLIRKFIADMMETMHDYGGVGLAAPQVHISRRIFIVEVPQLKGRGEYEPVPLTVLINPEITALSKDMQHNYEGCLSIPDLTGYVPRFNSIKVSYTDPDGNRIGKKFTGFP